MSARCISLALLMGDSSAMHRKSQAIDFQNFRPMPFTSPAVLFTRARIVAQATPAPKIPPNAAPKSVSVSLVTVFALGSGNLGVPAALPVVLFHDIDMPRFFRQFLRVQQSHAKQFKVAAARLHRTPEMRSGDGAIGSVRASKIAFRRELEPICHMAPIRCLFLAHSMCAACCILRLLTEDYFHKRAAVI